MAETRTLREKLRTCGSLGSADVNEEDMDVILGIIRKHAAEVARQVDSAHVFDVIEALEAMD